MDIKLSKYILDKVHKVHRNVEQNAKYVPDMNTWLKKYFDLEFKFEELEKSKIVTGRVMRVNGVECLRVEGYPLATINRGGSYCNHSSYQAARFHGEFYIRIDANNFLQILYSC